MADKKPPKAPKPKMDFRERLGYMIVGLVVMVFGMIYTKPALTTNDGFMLLAQAIVISALIGGVIAWSYSQAKGDDDTAGIMQAQADALKSGADPAWAPEPQQPQPDVNIDAESVTVTEKGPADGV